MSFQIAMDGPVAAGKGTVARLTAQRLNLLYVDTGAMYRTTALLALQKNIPVENEDQLVTAIQNAKIEMRNPTENEKDGRLTTVLLDGVDVSWEIRTENVSRNSSKVAALKKIRQVLVEKQQEIAASQDVVMEGRDITFRVLPNAQLKIFLTASDETRAKRRLVELQSKGQDVTFQAVYTDLLERDKRDMERAVDPLHITDDSWVIDTSELNINEVVNLIVTKAKEIQDVQKAEENLEKDNEKAAAIAQATEEIEAEKERKKQEREERKFLKEQKIISQRRQRFVAPILLLVTILVSFLIWKMSQ